MKYACFAKICDLERVKQVGFDGVELDLCQLRRLDEREYAGLKEKLSELGLRVCAFSWIMENTIHICDPAFDREGWLGQFQRDARRIAGLGCDIVVFAAGPIRSVGADSGTPAKKKTVNAFILDAAKVFAEHGVRVALETVCFDYTDYLTALEESAALCAEGKNLYLLTDIRHLVRAGDEPDDIVRFAGSIIHAHIDNPIKIERVAPLPGDGYRYDFFIRRVASCNARWLSFECHDEPDWARNGPISLNYIKSLVDKYSDPLRIGEDHE